MENRHIVAIEKLKRRKHWKKCVFDSGEFIEIPDEILIRRALSVGSSVTAKKYAELESDVEIARGKEQALRLLSYRARSEKELEKQMKKSGIDRLSVHAIIDDLKRLNLIDDEMFARKFVHDLIRRKPAGEFLLKSELQKKGISESTINRVVDQAFDEVSPVEIARKGVRQWLMRHPHSPSVERRKKIAQFLYQRGFSWSIIDQVMGDQGAF